MPRVIKMSPVIRPTVIALLKATIRAMDARNNLHETLADWERLGVKRGTHRAALMKGFTEARMPSVSISEPATPRCTASN
jgi:hypothetical protein